MSNHDSEGGDEAFPEKFHTKVAGISRRVDAARTCRPRDVLILHREPENPADEKAVAIYTRAGLHIGYLNRARADQIAHWIDAGTTYYARVVEITGQGYENMGINIEVWRGNAAVPATARTAKKKKTRRRIGCGSTIALAILSFGLYKSFSLLGIAGEKTLEAWIVIALAGLGVLICLAYMLGWLDG